MTTVDRIFQLMKENNLNAKEFALKVGVSQGNITDWKTGRAKPSTDALLKIARTYNISVDYLLGNSDYKNQDDFFNQNIYDIANTLDKIESFDLKLFDEGLPNLNFDVIVDQLISLDISQKHLIKNALNYIPKEFPNSYKEEALKIICDLYRYAKLENKKVSPSQFYMCPVYGKISAGIPNWAEECLEGYLPIDPNLMDIVNPEECFFLKVNGESMNKVIRNGAYALIRKQDIVKNGEIAAVLVNGFEATLKKFTKQGELVILEPMSNDPSFTTQVYNKDTDIKILGKYIGKFEMNK